MKFLLSNHNSRSLSIIMSFMFAVEIFCMLHSSCMITPGEKNLACVFEQRSIHTLATGFNTDDNEFSFDFNRPTLYTNDNGIIQRTIESTKYSPLWDDHEVKTS